VPLGHFPGGVSYDQPQPGERVMISFEKKRSDLPQPVGGETEQNRFERIRKLAAEKHRKADSDGTPRRDRQTAEDNRLI
jgi:hypothetical protein